MIKAKELDIADRMMDIVEKEITGIEGRAEPDDRDIIKLEKLAKVYATLMANHRENIKNGIYGKLTDEELDKAVDSGGAGSESDEADEDVL